MSTIMTPDSDEGEAKALEWTIRVQHPDFEEWDALSDWLAENPRHAEGFHRLTLLDAEIASVVAERPSGPRLVASSPAPETPANDRTMPRRHWALLAASVALILVLVGIRLGHVGPAPGTRSTIIAVATKAGERRDIRLADGTRIMLAGATHLSIDPAARSAILDEGQATFNVTHDPSRPFVLRLGDATITDVGTIFDARHRDGRSIVAVAQGEVRVDGAGDPIALTAGRRLRLAGASTPQLDAIAPNAVTGWQEGRFSYADAPISEVVADIEQTTGARIRMAPGVADLRFAGTLAINRDAGRALRDVAPVLGLSAVRDGEVWVLSSALDAQRR